VLCEVERAQDASFLALTCAWRQQSRCSRHGYDAAHDAFMTLPPYARIKEGEAQELGFGVSNGSHIARSRPVEASRERMEQEGPAASAQGTARCASCMLSPPRVTEK
jgi:hypothetical protein